MRRQTWQRFSDAAIATLDAYHAERPDLRRPGTEKLRPRAPSAPADAAVRGGGAALGSWTSRGALDRAWLRRPPHEVRMTPEEERIWSRGQPMLGTRIASARRGCATWRMNSGSMKVVRRVFRLAARRGEVDEIALDHFFLADTVAEMAEIAMDIGRTAEAGRFNAAEFRDRLDNGRKVAIQILEYFDRQGFTMRRGDWRRINPNRAGMFVRRTEAAPAQIGGDASPVGRPDFKSGKGRETVLGGFNSHSLPPVSARGAAMSLVAAFLDVLQRAASNAASAETAYRREAAERIEQLERERSFAFRRVNLMKPIADAAARAESEELAVASSQAILRAKLGWSGDTEARSAVLTEFAKVAQALFGTFHPVEDQSPADVLALLSEFEGLVRKPRIARHSGNCSTSRCRRRRLSTSDAAAPEFNDWIVAEFDQRGSFTALGDRWSGSVRPR